MTILSWVNRTLQHSQTAGAWTLNFNFFRRTPPPLDGQQRTALVILGIHALASVQVASQQHWRNQAAAGQISWSRTQLTSEKMQFLCFYWLKNVCQHIPTSAPLRQICAPGFTARCYVSAAFAVVVCLSVTGRYCVETTWRIELVFWHGAYFHLSHTVLEGKLSICKNESTRSCNFVENCGLRKQPQVGQL